MAMVNIRARIGWVHFEWTDELDTDFQKTYCFAVAALKKDFHEIFLSIFDHAVLLSFSGSN